MVGKSGQPVEKNHKKFNQKRKGTLSLWIKEETKDVINEIKEEKKRAQNLIGEDEWKEETSNETLKKKEVIILINDESESPKGLDPLEDILTNLEDCDSNATRIITVNHQYKIFWKDLKSPERLNHNDSKISENQQRLSK